MMAQSTTPASGNNAIPSNASGGSSASGNNGGGSTDAMEGEGTEALDLAAVEAGS